MHLYVSLLNSFLSLLMLAFNWRMNRNVLFLSSLILLISVYSVTYYFLAIGQSRYWAAICYTNLAPLWFLPGPCLYWYVRGNLEDRISFRRNDILHLLPFVISLIGIFPYLITPFQHKLATVDALFLDPNIPKSTSPNWLLPVEWNLLLRPALLMAYAMYCLGMVLKAQRSFSRSSAVAQDQWVFLRNWMMLLSGILMLISMPSLFLSYAYSFDVHIDYARINAYSMSSATVYVQTLLSVTLLVFPQILYGIPRVATFESGIPSTGHPHAVKDSPVRALEPGEPVQRMNAGMQQEQGPFVELGQRVLRYMEERKPYVDPDFTLDGLARSMGVPKHHLYYCFQNVLKTKFTRLRTEYRIEHAKRQLAEADLTQTTLIVLGRESGFASTSAFYMTFKAEVGCSPGEYAAKVNPTASGG